MRVARLILLLAGLVLLAVPAQAQAAPIVLALVAGQTITAAMVMSAIFQSIVSFALSSIASSVFGKSSAPQQQDQGSFQAQASGRLHTVRSAVATRKLAYGEFMTSGPLVYAETTSPPGGNENNYLHMVIAVAPRLIASFEETWFGDEKVGALDVDGNVTTGRFAGYARIKYHLGATDQVADADLVAESAGKWTADHRLLGIAYVYVRLKWSQSVWPGGIPNVKCLIRGHELYDPRDGGTRYTNNWRLVMRDYLVLPATSGGLGASTSEVNDTEASASANVCDERVAMASYSNTFTADASTDEITLTDTETTIATGDGVNLTTTGTLPAGLALATTYYWIRTGPTSAKLATSYANSLAKTAIDITGAGTGTHTVNHVDQARYTANGSVDTASKPKDILSSLLTAAAGILTYPQGQFKALPAAYDTPTVTLTASDLRGTVKVTPRMRRSDLFNAVQGVYSNPANYWQPSSFPVVTSATYETQDGGERIVRDIELAFTTDAIRAQRIAKVHLEKSRQGMVVSMPCKFTAFRLAMWDAVNVTLDAFGWSSKVFRVINWQLAEDGLGVNLVLREDSSASYDWAAGDATVVDPAPDTNLPNAFAVGIPGTPAVVEEVYETTGSAGVKTRAIVSWGAPADAFVSAYEAQYKALADLDWLSLAPISLLSAQANDLAPGFYQFRVRSSNSFNVTSDWSATTTKEMLGLTAAPAAVTGFTVTKSAGFALVSLAQHPDLDVRIGGALVVRHSPLTTGATWEGTVIFEELVGDAVQGLVPLRTGTYFIKARDSSGNYSATAASFVATEGLVTGFTTVGTLTEHSAFTGSKTNVAVLDAGLRLDSVDTISDRLDVVSAWPKISALGGITGSGEYLFTAGMDCATVATRRVEFGIAAQCFDTGDTIGARLDPVSMWSSIAGAAVNDCDAQTWARFTDDNPAGSPTWSAWKPFYVADETFRAMQCKATLASGQSTHNISVTSLSVTAKIPA